MLEFLDEMKNKKDDEKLETVNLSKNIVFNPNMFKEILYNLDKHSEQEIIDTIKVSYHIIFSDKFIMEDPSHLGIVTNHKFLTAAIRVFSSLSEIEYSTFVYCNKIVYDYVHTYITDEYTDTRNILYSLLRVINKKQIQLLLSIGLPEDIALELLNARYSANTETANITRLILTMQSIDSNTIDTQMAVNIFEKLFDELGLLFQIIMFTPISQGFPETYENIGLAILFMINNMPSIAIKKVLTGYTTAFESGLFRQHYKSGNNVIPGDTYRRYNLETLDYRFSRITGMISMLKEEQIYVP